MRCPSTWGLLLLLAACEARINGAPGDPAVVDAAAVPDVDATPDDAAPPDALVLGAWSTPVKIPQASTMLGEDDPTLSSNTLEMIFAIDGGANGKDLYYSSRPSVTAPWTTAVKLPFNNATLSDETPRLSADDKTLFFASARAGKGNLDIYSVTHPNPDSTSWGNPQLLGTSVNTTTLGEKWYMPCGTHYIVGQSTSANGFDMLEGTLGSAGTPITTLNSAQNETGTFLSPDCLTIQFASSRPTSTSPTKLYKSTRTAPTAAWQPPSLVVDFPIGGSTDNQEDPWMSADTRTFVFAADPGGTGNKDIYISTR
jgi:hypothetical protein